jgi:hypothetical protein
MEEVGTTDANQEVSTDQVEMPIVAAAQVVAVDVGTTGGEQEVSSTDEVGRPIDAEPQTATKDAGTSIDPNEEVATEQVAITIDAEPQTATEHISHIHEDDDWFAEDERFDASGEVAQENEVSVQQSNAIDLTDDTNNPFINAYLGSIQKPRDTIAGQWRECTWDKKSLDVRDPATIDEVVCLVSCPLCLKTILLPQIFIFDTIVCIVFV